MRFIPPPPLPAAAMMPPITAPPPIIHGSNDPPAALAGNKTSSPGIPLKPETPSNQYKIQPSSSKPDQNQLCHIRQRSFR